MENTDKILDVEFKGSEKEKYSKLMETANEYAMALVDERMGTNDSYFKDAAYAQTARVTALCLINSLQTGRKVNEVDIFEVLSDLKVLEKTFESAKKITGIEFTPAGYSIHTDHPVYYVMRYFNKNLSAVKNKPHLEDYEFARDMAIAINNVFYQGKRPVETQNVKKAG